MQWVQEFLIIPIFVTTQKQNTPFVLIKNFIELRKPNGLRILNKVNPCYA